ncbi:hypothetical protein [Streptomyces sp. NPDC047718]|uniref:hypothetical protein n=1 Tax=Streptomyces sp. NPDC047718 TaxID=3155479 RepID=UPI0033E83F0F
MFERLAGETTALEPVSPAWRLGAIGRAASWGRVFPEAAGTSTAKSPNSANGHSDSARWLLELLAEPAL